MSKVKTKVINKTTKKQSKSNLRCGDCIHHSRGPKKEGKEAKCSLLGVSEFVTAPSCFTPDTKKLASTKIPITQIAELVNRMDSSELRILQHVLKESAKIKEKTKEKFVFGQEVFVNLGGGYLTHYFKAYVISVVDGYINLGSKLKPKSKTVTYIQIPVGACGLLTKRQFKKVAAQLIEEGRVAQDKSDFVRWKSILMPEKMDSKGRVNIDVPSDIELEKYLDTLDAPTIDTAPKDTEVKKKKKKSTAKTKLTDIYNKDGNMLKLS